MIETIQTFGSAVAILGVMMAMAGGGLVAVCALIEVLL